VTRLSAGLSRSVVSEATWQQSASASHEQLRAMRDSCVKGRVAAARGG